ncbi:hypothetical protein [Gordonia sp. CPCC 205333]|uniref:DoxX family protein n=1 Tax=Gordonia sp. CPCC 205333 TaxID=3140790 RepID=UPI003AF34DB4
MSTQRLSHIMAFPLIFMGVLHFVAPKPFDALIPDEIPGDKRTLTYASGVAEAAIGGGLLFPRTRRLAAAGAAALFIAVFPANINMVRLWQDKPAWMKTIAWLRLPLQIPMVLAAVKVYRGSAPAERA